MSNMMSPKGYPVWLCICNHAMLTRVTRKTLRALLRPFFFSNHLFPTTIFLDVLQRHMSPITSESKLSTHNTPFPREISIYFHHMTLHLNTNLNFLL
jgi:hypothetical protein